MYNPRYMKDPEYLKSVCRRMDEIKLSVKIDPNGLFQHEIGHVVHAIDKTLPQLIYQKFIQGGQAAKTAFSKGVGSYGYKNSHELFAELFRAYKQGILPPEFDYFRQIIKDKGW